MGSATKAGAQPPRGMLASFISHVKKVHATNCCPPDLPVDRSVDDGENRWNMVNYQAILIISSMAAE